MARTFGMQHVFAASAVAAHAKFEAYSRAMGEHDQWKAERAKLLEHLSLITERVNKYGRHAKDKDVCSDTDYRRSQNKQHVADPQPGDYWHEMFTPVCLVLDASKFHVALLCDAKHVSGGWNWDTSKVTVLSRAAFVAKLMYEQQVDQGTWCDVVPEWAHWRVIADEALKVRS
jgi:hypothetical protein